MRPAADEASRMEQTLQDYIQARPAGSFYVITESSLHYSVRCSNGWG